MVRKLNILFCDRLSPRSPDGQSTHIHELLSGLSKIGHNVVALNADYTKGHRDGETNMKPTAWTRIKNSVSQSRLLKPVAGEIALVWSFLYEMYIFISAFILIARRRERFDLIYRRHNLFSGAYVLGRLFGIPSVKEVNGIVADEAKIKKRWDRGSLWVIDKIERLNMAKADKFIVVTPKLKELLHSEYGVKSDRITVIQNGVNTDVFRPMNTIKVREELILRQNHNYICFVGLLAQWQGIEYVIRSMPIVLSKCPQTQLIIVGEGETKQELIKLSEQVGISDKVMFAGMVPYQKVPLYMNASDVCIAPKVGLKSGYSPLKLYEYMACEKPVVASRASGLEILEDIQGGILVEPGNSIELATAIIKLLKERKLRKQMGENSRKYALQNQSWECVAKRVTEVLSETTKIRYQKGI